MAKNAGGKIALEKGKETRFLENDGRISKDIYVINSTTTDYKARALLKNELKNVLVHYDRLLPTDCLDKAICVLGNKSILATCPLCGTPHNINSTDVNLTCCSRTFELFYMPEASKEMNKEDNAFDLNSISDKCEVWYKDGKFTDGIDLRTVQLVIKDENPRKLIFNLYNGKLSASGKKSNLRLDEFVAGSSTDGKSFWYKVDLSKYENALTSKDYIKYVKSENTQKD